MPTDPRQLDLDAAVREVVTRAAQPTDINRLVAAAVRLRSAHLALRADPSPADPIDHGVLDGPIAGVSVTFPLDEDDEPATVWLDLPAGALFPDQAGLTADQAARLASALAAAVEVARGADQ